MSFMCCGCLSKERRLFRLCQVSDGVNLLYSLSRWISKVNIPKDEMSKMMVCWECKAMLLRIRRFMRQVSEAQQLLTEVPAGCNNENAEKSLSNLACHYITGYDKNIEYEETNTELSHNFVDISIDDLTDKSQSSDDHSTHANESDYEVEEEEEVEMVMGLDDEPKVKLQVCTIVNQEPYTSMTLLTPECCTSVTSLTPDCTAVTSEPCMTEIDLKSDSDDDDDNCLLVSDYSVDNTEDLTPATHRGTDNTTEPKSRILIVRLERCIIPQESKEHSHQSVTSNYTRSLKPNDGTINKYKCLLSPKQLICNICGRNAGCVQAMASHIQTHGQCAICSEWFQTKTALKNHIKDLHNTEIKESQKKTFVCEICGERTFARHTFISHFKFHKQCKVCKEWLLSKSTLEYHMKRIHKMNVNDIKENSNKYIFLCDICGKKTSGIYNLTCHIKSHRQCTLCDKWFHTNRNLEKHKHTHKQKSRVICEICGKEFSNESFLNNHKLTHRSISRTCKLCNKDFGNKRRLRYHNKTFHAKKQFKCDQCEKSFHLHASVRKHMIVHNASVSFDCKICGRKFNQKSNVSSHFRRVHCRDQRKIFTCDICKKNFREKAHLVTHVAMHSDIKPYVCDRCGKRFFQRSHFNEHKSRQVCLQNTNKKRSKV